MLPTVKPEARVSPRELGDEKLGNRIPAVGPYSKGLLDGLGQPGQSVIFYEPEHTDVFPGSLPLLFSLQLQTTMEEIEALREIEIRQR